MAAAYLKVKGSQACAWKYFLRQSMKPARGDLSSGDRSWSERMDWPWDTEAVSHESRRLTGERRRGAQDLLRSEGGGDFSEGDLSGGLVAVVSKFPRPVAGQS